MTINCIVESITYYSCVCSTVIVFLCIPLYILQLSNELLTKSKIVGPVPRLLHRGGVIVSLLHASWLILALDQQIIAIDIISTIAVFYQANIILYIFSMVFLIFIF